MMMRKLTLLTSLTILLLGLAACSLTVSPSVVDEKKAAPIQEAITLQNNPATTPAQAASDPSDELTVADETGTTSLDKPALESALTVIPIEDLSDEEASGLLYMREEEKLAHDVYLFLYNIWGSQIFQNIAASELTHTDSVKILLDKYGLVDPSAGMAAGQFTDPTLQGIYEQFTAQGNQSLADAFKVGATIEEIDLLDLQERMAQTTHEDIQLVYQNLEKGSGNHLRSFVNSLGNQVGETYQPQYLNLEAFDTILSASIERGGPSQGRNGAGENGYGGNGAGGNRP